MPQFKDDGWRKNDPNAPTLVGPGPAPEDFDELLKEAFDAMWKGEYYRGYRGENVPEWYEDVFPIPKIDPANGNNEVHYPNLMKMMEDPVSGKRIGYALGVLSNMSNDKLKACFESSGQALGNARVDFFKWYLKSWMHAVAPLLQILSVSCWAELMALRLVICQTMDFMKDDVRGWSDEKVATVRKILTDNECTWDGSESAFSFLKEGFQEARRHYPKPASGVSMMGGGGAAAMDALRNQFTGGSQGQDL